MGGVCVNCNVLGFIEGGGGVIHQFQEQREGLVYPTQFIHRNF